MDIINQNVMSSTISRKLYSSYYHCNSNCAYCFAKWDGVYSPQPFFEFETAIFDNDIIIYPCCDGEIINRTIFFERLKKQSDLSGKIYISFSTKTGISDEILSSIISLNDYFVNNNKGFVKLSISLSTKAMLEYLEKGTLAYEDRLTLARKFVSSGINTSVSLKPILPFVSTEEYYEIIDDCSKIVDRLLIGGLYVEENSLFYKKWIADHYKIIKREVSWLPNHPLWSYVDQEEKLKDVRQYAEKKKMLVFDCDVDLIKSFCIE